MAWTTPRDWLVGELVTAADLNTHVRDNLNFLYGPPACRLWHSANQTATSGAELLLTFDTELEDTDSMHSAGSPTVISATTAGVYLGAGGVEMSAGVTSALLYLTCNSSAGPVFLSEYASYRSTPRIAGSGVTTLAVSDTMNIEVFHTTGTDETVNSTANYSPLFMALWIGGT